MHSTAKTSLRYIPPRWRRGMMPLPTLLTGIRRNLTNSKLTWKRSVVLPLLYDRLQRVSKFSHTRMSGILGKIFTCSSRWSDSNTYWIFFYIVNYFQLEGHVFVILRTDLCEDRYDAVEEDNHYLPRVVWHNPSTLGLLSHFAIYDHHHHHHFSDLHVR